MTTKEKNKFTLTGTDNDGFRHRYSIEKNEKFKKAFLDFMLDLEFDVEKIKKGFVVREEDNETSEEKIYTLKISDFEDYIRHYQNNKFDVDVFYGNKKIIITVRSKSRFPIVKHLENKAEWISEARAENIRKDTKIKIPLQKSKR